MYLSAPSAFDNRFTPNRPVVLFGHEIEVRRSTALTFSPELIFFAGTGESLKAKLETQERPLWNVLRAIARAEGSGGRVRSTTASAFARESLRNGDFSPLTLQRLKDLPDSTAAAWRIAFRCRHGFYKVERRLLTRLATADRLAHLTTATADAEEAARRRHLLFAPGLRYWIPTELGLPWECIAPLDVALLTLARLEREFTQAMPDLWRSGSITDLAAGPREPMRLWFENLMGLSACDSYGEFADYLTRRGYSTKEEDGANPGRLSKWANGLEPLRATKAASLLLACEGPIVRSLEIRRFFYARVLTFLVEWARACAQNPPERESVWRAVHRRLLQWRDAE